MGLTERAISPRWHQSGATDRRNTQTDEENCATKSVTNEAAAATPLARCDVLASIRKEGGSADGVGTSSLPANNFLLTPARPNSAMEDANLLATGVIRFPFNRQLGENPA